MEGIQSRELSTLNALMTAQASWPEEFPVGRSGEINENRQN